MCEIQLVDRSVSRHHARISQVDGLYYVEEDLGGKSGVTLNAQKVRRERLQHQDTIIIPPFQLEFLADGNESQEPAEAVVEVEGVSKEYVLGKQTVTALQDISLTIAGGEFMALAGPSGSGKSTLLNLIGCIDTPTSGTVRIKGQDISGKSPDDLADLRLNTLGFVFQTFNLLPVLSAWENVEYPLLQQHGLNKQTRQERVTHYLKVGSCISPFNAWLVMRGVRTLAMRMDAHSRNAAALAAFLAGHPLVAELRYPVHESHPDHAVTRRLVGDPTGGRYGGMMAIRLHGGRATMNAFANALEVCELAVSLGDARTLITHPASTTHSVISREARLTQGVTDGLVRLSVGLEDVEDLIVDLAAGL